MLWVRSARPAWQPTSRQYNLMDCPSPVAFLPVREGGGGGDGVFSLVLTRGPCFIFVPRLKNQQVASRAASQ